MKKALIIALLAFLAGSASAQYVPLSLADYGDSITLAKAVKKAARLDTLNVGKLQRQSHTLKYTAALTMTAGVYLGNAAAADNAYEELALPIWLGFGIASLTQFIISEVKAYRSYAILERLHPIPNGIAIDL